MCYFIIHILAGATTWDYCLMGNTYNNIYAASSVQCRCVGTGGACTRCALCSAPCRCRQTDRDKLASARGAAHGVAGTQLKRPRAGVVRRRGPAHCSRAPSLVHALCQNFKTARRVVSDGTVPPESGLHPEIQSAHGASRQRHHVCSGKHACMHGNS